MTLRMYWDIPKVSARAEVVACGDMSDASGVSGKVAFLLTSLTCLLIKGLATRELVHLDQNTIISICLLGISYICQFRGTVSLILTQFPITLPHETQRRPIMSFPSPLRVDAA